MVTGLVLVSLGHQRGAPVLSPGPVRTDVTAADLTVGDRQALAALAELVRQFTTGSPAEHLALLGVLHETLVRLGLTATTTGVDTRRGLVPPALLGDIDTLAPDTTPEGRDRLESDYWNRLRQRVFVNGYYPLHEPPPRPLPGPVNDGTHVPQFPPPGPKPPSGSDPQPPTQQPPTQQPHRPADEPPTEPPTGPPPEHSKTPGDGHRPPGTPPVSGPHPPPEPTLFGPRWRRTWAIPTRSTGSGRDALAVLGTSPDLATRLAALQRSAQAGAALLLGGVLPTGVGSVCGLFGTTVFLALLSGQTALLELLGGLSLPTVHDRFGTGCPEHTAGWEQVLQEYVVHRDDPAALSGLIDEVRSVLAVAGTESLGPRATEWVRAVDVPVIQAFEQLLLAPDRRAGQCGVRRGRDPVQPRAGAGRADVP